MTILQTCFFWFGVLSLVADLVVAGFFIWFARETKRDERTIEEGRAKLRQSKGGSGPKVGVVVLKELRIGECGDPVDKLRVEIVCGRTVPDLIVGLDGVRKAWVVGASFRTHTTSGDDNFEFRELALIPESDMDADRFASK
jgi:hypothetical protein